VREDAIIILFVAAVVVVRMVNRLVDGSEMGGGVPSEDFIGPALPCGD
jgi:hypothetical protein